MTRVSRVAVLHATQLGLGLPAFAHPVTDRIGSGGPILTKNDAATA